MVTRRVIGILAILAGLFAARRLNRARRAKKAAAK